MGLQSAYAVTSLLYPSRFIALARVCLCSSSRPRGRPAGTTGARAPLAMVHCAPLFSVASWLPRHRHRHAQPGPRARRKRRGGRGAVAVAQVVDEDLADAVGRARSWRTKRVGITSRQVLHDRLREALDGVPVERGAIGTTTCRPLPPLVFSQASSPSSSSNERTSMAASCTRCHGTPSPGSRSKTTRSGLSMLLRGRVPGVELDHVHLRRLGDAPWPVRTSSSASCPGHSAGSSSVTPGMLHLVQRASGRTARRRCRSGPRTSEHGPALQVRQHPLGHALVVAHQVELGEAGARDRSRARGA